MGSEGGGVPPPGRVCLGAASGDATPSPAMTRKGAFVSGPKMGLARTIALSRAKATAGGRPYIVCAETSMIGTARYVQVRWHDCIYTRCGPESVSRSTPGDPEKTAANITPEVDRYRGTARLRALRVLSAADPSA